MTDTNAILSTSDLTWLLDRLVRRLQQGLPLDKGTLTIASPTTAQRRSIDNLLGRRTSKGHNLTIDLARLPVTDLEATILHLHGPIDNRRAERQGQAIAWSSLFAQFAHQAATCPPLQRWLNKLQSGGLLKRLAKSDIEVARNLLSQAWSIIKSPPHHDILLASLATQISGNSHALDRSQPLSTLCLRAIFEISGIDGTAHANARRDAWATIGVIIDDLSAPVLCLNLRVAAHNDLAPWIDWHIARGEPYYLTWRHLKQFTPSAEMEAVHVCENPAIVSEAAQRLAIQSRPLICLNGMPGTTARHLLAKISAAGIPLHVRADFDWTGLRIIEQLHHLPHLQLWRMTAQDYHTCPPGQPLKGSPFIPPWATELANTMRTAGHAAYEEGLITPLIDDLTASPPFILPCHRNSSPTRSIPDTC